MDRVLFHVGNLHDFLDRVVDLSSFGGKVVLELANDDGRFLWNQRWELVFISPHHAQTCRGVTVDAGHGGKRYDRGDHPAGQEKAQNGGEAGQIHSCAVVYSS